MSDSETAAATTFLPIYYKDDSGTTQGPFHPCQMHTWYTNGHLPKDLLFRRGEDGEYASIESKLPDPFGIGELAKGLPRKEEISNGWIENVRSWVALKGWDANMSKKKGETLAKLIHQTTKYPIEGSISDELE